MEDHSISPAPSLDGGEANLQWMDLLRHPPATGTCAHLLQFYQDDDFLANAVAFYAGAGLHQRQSVVIIATKDHRDRTAVRLQRQGFDVRQLQQRRQLMLLDASETLAKFMVDGRPDAPKFRELIGGLLREMKARHGFVRAYGEMVGLLRDANNAAGSEALEGLWNDLAQAQPFALLCGYHLNSFSGRADGPAFTRVCDSHTHVMPDENFVRLDGARDQMRGVAALQRKVRELEQHLAATAWGRTAS